MRIEDNQTILIRYRFFYLKAVVLLFSTIPVPHEVFNDISIIATDYIQTCQDLLDMASPTLGTFTLQSQLAMVYPFTWITEHHIMRAGLLLLKCRDFGETPAAWQSGLNTALRLLQRLDNTGEGTLRKTIETLYTSR